MYLISYILIFLSSMMKKILNLTKELNYIESVFHKCTILRFEFRFLFILTFNPLIFFSNYMFSKVEYKGIFKLSIDDHVGI